MGLGGFWNDVSAYVPAGARGLDGPLLSLQPSAAVATEAASSSRRERWGRITTSASAGSQPLVARPDCAHTLRRARVTRQPNRRRRDGHFVPGQSRRRWRSFRPLDATIGGNGFRLAGAYRPVKPP